MVMRWTTFLLLLASFDLLALDTRSPLKRPKLHGGGVLLSGEPVPFDRELRPRFTERQLKETAGSTRAGLVRWAATAEGQRLLTRFLDGEWEINVVENAEEQGPGRAPQPGIRMMLSISDRSKVKRYDLVLNPTFAAQYGRGNVLAFGSPVTPNDVMAATWAAEMLHIDFYSRGIPLPHHRREAFQARWREVASQLGFARMTHQDEFDPTVDEPGPRFTTIGDGRN